MALPNFSKIELPKELKTIEQIPMEHLIAKLHQLRTPRIKKPMSPWIWVVLGMSSTIVLGLAFFFYIKCKGPQICMSHWLATKWDSKKQAKVTANYAAVMYKTNDGVRLLDRQADDRNDQPRYVQAHHL